MQAQRETPVEMTSLDWSVAVFGYNEAHSLPGCLRALAEARHGAAMRVTLVLNGSTDGSPAVAMAAMRQHGLRGRVWGIAAADKANAINQYLHRLRDPAAMHVFVDAYAAVAPDALRYLARRLDDSPGANGAAAVPSTGRSAAKLSQELQKYPGFHGSLFALRGSFVERIAARGLRLPYGMYRGDGLMGSLALHDLDALGGGWEGTRIAVEPRATWMGPVLRPWRWQDARRQWRRMVQQGRGRLQWPAIRDVIYDRDRPADSAGFAALPGAADPLTLDWLARNPARRPRWWRDPFAAIALRRMRQAPLPPSDAELMPCLLLETEA
jgi:hypothetical protein